MTTLRSITPAKRPLVLLTGGLRFPAQFHEALSTKKCDLLGIGRASVVQPELPNLTRQCPEQVKDRQPKLARLEWLPKIIGAGITTTWYAVQMRRIARQQELSLGMNSLEAVVRFWTPVTAAEYVALVTAAAASFFIIGILSKLYIS